MPDGSSRLRGRLRYYADLVHVLVAKEFKIRYKSTLLGYLWSVLHPLAFATVFFLLFKVVMRIQVENYALFLITGLFPWQWFQNSVSASNRSFLSNTSLIKKVCFPRAFLVLAGVLNDLLHFVLSIPVLVGFLLYYRLTPGWSWLVLVPALTGIQLLFTYGLALLTATLNVFFRDLERLTTIFLMVWFYLTPVLFPVEFIPPEYRWALYANPMAPLILSWREMFMSGTAQVPLVATALAWGLVTLLAGQAVYRRLQWRFAEVV